MASPHRFGFDPGSAAAGRLLRAVRAAENVEVEITRGLYVQGDHSYGPGERVTLPRASAERLVARGSARRIAGPSC